MPLLHQAVHGLSPSCSPKPSCSPHAWAVSGQAAPGGVAWPGPGQAGGPPRRLATGARALCCRRAAGVVGRGVSACPAPVGEARASLRAAGAAELPCCSAAFLGEAVVAAARQGPARLGLARPCPTRPVPSRPRRAGPRAWLEPGCVRAEPPQRALPRRGQEQVCSARLGLRETSGGNGRRGGALKATVAAGGAALRRRRAFSGRAAGRVPRYWRGEKAAFLWGAGGGQPA